MPHPTSHWGPMMHPTAHRGSVVTAAKSGAAGSSVMSAVVTAGATRPAMMSARSGHGSFLLSFFFHSMDML